MKHPIPFLSLLVAIIPFAAARPSDSILQAGPSLSQNFDDNRASGEFKDKTSRAVGKLVSTLKKTRALASGKNATYPVAPYSNDTLEQTFNTSGPAGSVIPSNFSLTSSLQLLDLLAFNGSILSTFVIGDPETGYSNPYGICEFSPNSTIYSKKSSSLRVPVSCMPNAFRYSFESFTDPSIFTLRIEHAVERTNGTVYLKSGLATINVDVKDSFWSYAGFGVYDGFVRTNTTIVTGLGGDQSDYFGKKK